MRKTSLASSPARYIVVPLLFVVGIFLVLGLTLGPVFAPYLGIAQYFFAKAPAAQPTDLFTGVVDSALADQAKIPLSSFAYPGKGDLYGNLVIGGTPVNAPVYYGDGTRQLNQGAGTYVDSFGSGIPGEGKTILIGGHNTTFFNGLQDVKEDDIVTFTTHYGKYEYRVTSMNVALATDESTYDFSRKDENLILYTCYPFDMFGLTAERYFVYAEYLSGPVIDPTS